MIEGFDCAAAAAAIIRALPSRRPLPLHEPRFIGREWDYVRDCLDSGWVSYLGSYVDRFEAMIAERFEVPSAVAIVNGTAALHIALLLSGVKAGDEVIAPALTFVATINAISYCGAIPHFVDSDPATLGIDPRKLDLHLSEIAEWRTEGLFNRKTGRRLRAVVPMHVFGIPVDMEILGMVASKWQLAVIEDSAEAIGIRWRGRPLGTFAPIGILSFNGNKVVTTGGGGAILFSDAELAALAKHLTTTAKIQHAWEFEHDRIGYNYRLPNINAALGCAQLETLDELLAAKQRLIARYRENLARVPGIKLLAMPAGSKGVPWLNAVLVPDRTARDLLLDALHREGVLARPAWQLMNRQAPYRDSPRSDLSIAEMLQERIVCLPSGAGMAN